LAVRAARRNRCFSEISNVVNTTGEQLVVPKKEEAEAGKESIGLVQGERRTH